MRAPPSASSRMPPRLARPGSATPSRPRNRLRREALPDPATLAAVRRRARAPGCGSARRQDEDFLRLRRGYRRPAGQHGHPARRRGRRRRTTPGPVVRDVPVAVRPRRRSACSASPGRRARAAPRWPGRSASSPSLHGPSDLRLVLLTEQPGRLAVDPLAAAPAAARRRRRGWLSVGTDPATWTKRIAELRELIAARRAPGRRPVGGPVGGLRAHRRRDAADCHAPRGDDHRRLRRGPRHARHRRGAFRGPGGRRVRRSAATTTARAARLRGAGWTRTRPTAGPAPTWSARPASAAGRPARRGQRALGR